MRGLLLNRKSQIFSLDILIAMLAFITILVSSIIIWDYSTETINIKERRNELESASMNVLSLLIETTGIPSNWSNFAIQDFNESNVHAIGLAKNNSLGLSYSGPWEIDQKKIYYLNSSTYERTKKILGLAGFEFDLTLKIYNGSDYASNYSVSGNITDASDITKLRRYALMDGQRAELILKVARNE